MGLAVGTFDGLHIGHQKICDVLRSEISSLSLEGNSFRMGMMSFYPHPRSVLKNNIEKTYTTLLTPLRVKLEILSSLQISDLFLVHFTDHVSQMSAEKFFESYIKPLNPSVIVVGKDWRFGKNREGDVQTLIHLANKYDVFVRPVELFAHNEMSKVGATQLRQLLACADLSTYFSLTKRFYRISGRVVRGEKRGSLLGFPTANIHSVHHVLPKQGVYKTNTIIDAVSYKSITNVGCKPTFTNGLMAPTVETHIFDFNSELYGKKIAVDFIEFIREEKKFQSKDDLITQILIDVKTARE